jgi:DNA-binding MarR family transcriptional regulator
MASRKRSLATTSSDLNSAAIHLLRGLRSVDRQSGLTAARLSALSVLVFGGPSTLGALARAEDVTDPTMTRIVDGLVSLGLSTRSRHPESGRQVLVSATEEGQQLMTTARQRRIDAIATALQTLTPAEREAIVTAAPALRALAQAVVR